jgi:hypothetical protein
MAAAAAAAVPGDSRGKALKGKGKADRAVRGSADAILAPDEGTRPGCSTPAEAPAPLGVEEARAGAGCTRMGPSGSAWGVALRLLRPARRASAGEEEDEEEEWEEGEDEDEGGVGGLLVTLRGSEARAGVPCGRCWWCWCWRSRGCARWAAGEPKAEPQARWLRPLWASRWLA